MTSCFATPSSKNIKNGASEETKTPELPSEDCFQVFTSVSGKIGKNQTKIRREKRKRQKQRKILSLTQCSYDSCTAKEPSSFNLDDTKEDIRRATEFYKLSANQRNVVALNNLYNRAVALYDGRGVEKNLSEAFIIFKFCAERGVANAQCNLGFMYQYGQTVTIDLNEAVKWFKLSAEQGCVYAQCNLGYMFDHGIGVKRDTKEAFKWHKLSEEQGNARSQCELGYMYRYYPDIKKDDVEAIKWYRKSAEQGDKIAQFNLGISYEFGKGTDKNLDEAIKWYQKSAEQGYADAQNRLGIIYCIKIPAEKDFVKGKFWYQASAKQGNFVGQYCLANLYSYNKDYLNAYKWYISASNCLVKDNQHNAERSIGVLLSDVDITTIVLTELFDSGDKLNNETENLEEQNAELSYRPTNTLIAYADLVTNEKKSWRKRRLSF